MSEFIISSEQLERIIESVEHDTGREINRVVIDGVRAREIVRCRDCVHYETDEVCDGCTLFDFADCSGSMVDKFCAWGEKR